MPDCSKETTRIVGILANALCLEIGVNYLPESLDECGSSLTSLYQALAFGPLPDEVIGMIGKIERAVRTGAHYGCMHCDAVFGHTDDLGLVTQARVDRLKVGEIRPIGICPVCQGDVHPRAAGE
jgi:hypothetical protein